MEIEKNTKVKVPYRPEKEAVAEAIAAHTRAGLSAFRAFSLAAAFLLILGCVYGKIKYSDIDRDQVHDFINKNYHNLQAYYSGEREQPGAIIMDLKDDNIALTGKKWHPIKSRQELLEMTDLMVRVYYKKMRGDAGVLGPRLQLILDKNSKLIGYFYSPVDNWPVRPKGANYSVDAVTYVDVRRWSSGGERGSKRGKSRSGSGGR